MKIRIISALLVTIAAAMLCGCKTMVERIVIITDTRQNIPVANKPFNFVESPDLEPLVKPGKPVRVTLDRNGEVHVRLREAFGWASIVVDGTYYVASLQAADIRSGGQFRLYGPRPLTDQTTNTYPSKYLLEIRKP